MESKSMSSDARETDCQGRQWESIPGQGWDTEKGSSQNLDGQGQDYETPGRGGPYV